ncbi:hypothetical protein CLOM_g22760 [Closterium sp. NIES-68]|nr:hypothetical protein CLOM_g22760 [Closterium sp. NIES-68]
MNHHHNAKHHQHHDMNHHCRRHRPTQQRVDAAAFHAGSPTTTFGFPASPPSLVNAADHAPRALGLLALQRQQQHQLQQLQHLQHLQHLQQQQQQQQQQQLGRRQQRSLLRQWFHDAPDGLVASSFDRFNQVNATVNTTVNAVNTINGATRPEDLDSLSASGSTLKPGSDSMRVGKARRRTWGRC